MSETEIHEGKAVEGLSQRIKPPLTAPNPIKIGVRELPRFLTVPQFTKGESFTIIIPTARRTWWWVLGFVVVGLWLVLVPMIFYASIGGGYDARGNWSAPAVNPVTFALWLLPLLGLTWVVWWWSFPRIRITADHEKIRVHDRVYDWDKAGGFRMGYSIGGIERSDEQGPYAGMRMAYGPWGDDLPFLLRKYYAPAYIMFLNQALKEIEPRTPNTMAESGITPALF